MNLLIITERVYNILDNKYQTLRYVIVFSIECPLEGIMFIGGIFY